MKTNILARNRCKTVSVLVATSLMLAAPVALGDEVKDGEQKAATPTTITTGSGAKYRTTVEQKPGGLLSPEDFRQASLLSSRILLHLSEAAQNIDQDQPEDAKSQLEEALSLVKIIRELLPTTEVTTIVRDSKGNEVYRDVDHVQDDRVPLHEGLVAVKVVEALTDAKRDAANVTGVRLAEADLLHTSVLLELDYVEGKLMKALHSLPDNSDEARQQLELAQMDGISYVVNKQDNPLVAAQMALQLAEQMIKQQRIEAAKANLQEAKNQLVLYRGVVGEREDDEVKKLEADITKLQANIGKTTAAEEIRGFWNQVANWFSREHRETRTSASEKSEATR